MMHFLMEVVLHFYIIFQELEKKEETEEGGKEQEEDKDEELEEEEYYDEEDIDVRMRDICHRKSNGGVSQQLRILPLIRAVFHYAFS